MKILIVDDDPKFRRFMQNGLEETGIENLAAEDCETARTVLENEGPFDLVLLDVMLPDENGWECLEKMRAGGDRTPVIFLTARHEVEERVKGLRLGADDYIIKPFDFAELLARIEAVHRRHQLSEIVIGDLRIDVERRLVERNGHRIEMSPREFDLLFVLAKSVGQPRTRKELLEEVWGIDFDPGTNVVNVQIARLRRKIDRFGVPLIHTRVGTGYVLVDPSAAEAGDSPRAEAL